MQSHSTPHRLCSCLSPAGLLSLALLLFASSAWAAPGADTSPGAERIRRLVTLAEESGFRETGRHAEAEALCTAFAAKYPQWVRCNRFGVTPEGRALLVMVVSQAGALTAARARELKLPVTLMQGGIHAGEIDGKDAGFLALREVLEGRELPGVLREQVWLFVPIFNVDGHERFGKWNRPNQRGPVEMGWRTTAQNYNLNREWVKADAPEMRAMLALINEWDPLAVVDLHVTNGAQFEHDIGIMVEPGKAGDADLQRAGTSLRDAVVAHLARLGSLPLPFYPAFIEGDNPASGIRDGVPPPRLSHGYFWLRNRLGMLVETHSWKDYPTRVRATRNVILGVLDQMARNGRQWRRLAEAADQRATGLGGQAVPLTFRTTEDFREIEFRGYAYARTLSDISGTLMTRYDEGRPEIWKLKLYDRVRPELVVEAPRGGYVVPVQHVARVQPWLQRHGLRYTVIKAGMKPEGMQTFRATHATPSGKPVEGRQPMTFKGRWQPEQRIVQPGSLFVPISQPAARLVLSLLEPQAPDSLAAWGEFNLAFDRREYMEPYVAEAVAREMLERDPALAAEFARRLREDPDFARSAEARLEFFYRRHASWDEQYNLYPVYRVDAMKP